MIKLRIKARAKSSIKLLDLRTVTLHCEGHVKTAKSRTPSLTTHTLDTLSSKTNVNN
jgi:hypothetical protein